VTAKEIDRLFVPLAAEPFAWFVSGEKKWELRKYGRQYTEKHVRAGRKVELRLGYSNPDRALWGVIISVERASTVEEFFDRVPYNQVIPIASSQSEAIALVNLILNLDPSAEVPVLGFQVVIEE
jgi:hypothetical protein